MEVIKICDTGNFEKIKDFDEIEHAIVSDLEAIGYSVTFETNGKGLRVITIMQPANDTVKHELSNEKNQTIPDFTNDYKKDLISALEDKKFDLLQREILNYCRAEGIHLRGFVMEPYDGAENDAVLILENADFFASPEDYMENIFTQINKIKMIESGGIL